MQLDSLLNHVCTTSAVSRSGKMCSKLSDWMQAPVWRVSWSITGGTLAVSDSQGGVTLWKEGLDGQWQQLSS